MHQLNCWGCDSQPLLKIHFSFLPPGAVNEESSRNIYSLPLSNCRVTAQPSEHTATYPVHHEINAIGHFRIQRTRCKIPKDNFFQHKSRHQPKAETETRCNNIFKHLGVNIKMLCCKCFLSLHRLCVLTSSEILEETSSSMAKVYFKHGEQHSSCSK